MRFVRFIDIMNPFKYTFEDMNLDFGFTEKEIQEYVNELYQ